MVEVQKGTTQLPILVTPRINGLDVTVSQIKTQFSNFFVDDATTPIAFTLETRTRTGTVATIAWDSIKSTDSIIFFLPADAFYNVLETYTIIPYWTIASEKIYAQESVQLVVKQLHDGI